MSTQVRPIPLVEFVLVAGLEGEFGDGLEQVLEVAIFDDDERPLEELARTSFRLTPSLRGHPPRAFAVLRFLRGPTFVPDYGDYHFHILSAGRDLGSIRLSVTETPIERET